jgi:prepilin signal peptidase PulO-like enzyme (type II secretory pathway)
MRVWIIVLFCLVIGVFDAKTYRIPDLLLVFLGILMVLFDIDQDIVVLQEHLACFLLLFVLFGSIYYFSGGLGFGDVKYAAVLGYAMGLFAMITMILLSAFLCILVYIVGLKIFHWNKTVKLPFAPFLSAGAIIALAVDLDFTRFIP